jgi:hypothetical protein
MGGRQDAGRERDEKGGYEIGRWRDRTERREEPGIPNKAWLVSQSHNWYLTTSYKLIYRPLELIPPTMVGFPMPGKGE